MAAKSRFANGCDGHFFDAVQNNDVGGRFRAAGNHIFAGAPVKGISYAVFYHDKSWRGDGGYDDDCDDGQQCYAYKNGGDAHFFVLKRSEDFAADSFEKGADPFSKRRIFSTRFGVF